jgi:hypothetical protein
MCDPTRIADCPVRYNLPARRDVCNVRMRSMRTAEAAVTAKFGKVIAQASIRAEN